VKAEVVFGPFPFLSVKEICSVEENSELHLLQKIKTCTRLHEMADVMVLGGLHTASGVLSPANRPGIHCI
jgi:hypothetical protein